MTYEEFTEAVGTEIIYDDYKMIEKVYTYFDSLFPNKDSVYKEFKTNGIALFLKLYDSAVKIEKANADKRKWFEESKALKRELFMYRVKQYCENNNLVIKEVVEKAILDDEHPHVIAMMLKTLNNNVANLDQIVFDIHKDGSTKVYPDLIPVAY